MNRDAIKRFLTLLSSAVKVERGQLYQLVQSAEASYYLRDVQAQHEIALLLQSFGFPFVHIGKYYESIYLSRIGQNEKAREILECVAESAPAPYRSKALLSLSTVEQRIGHFEESLRLRQKISSCDDPLTTLEAQRGIALLRGIEGDHSSALRDLEKLMPLAHIVGKRNHPAYCTFLNSYTIELVESGQEETAEQVASIIAGSPFIGRYPEWQETVAEIAERRKRSSIIAVSREIAPQEARVRAAIEFMYKNHHRKMLVPEIAKAVGLSTSYFIRVFTDEAGIPPGRYLTNLRMKKARKLLATKYLSVKQVMAAVGYDTKSNFSRAFKQYYRMLPSVYRKRARGI